MHWLINTPLGLVLLINLFMLGASRMRSLIYAAAAQGAILSALPLLLEKQLDVMVVFIALMTMAIKGWLIPQLLHKALRDAQIKREVQPLIGFLPSMLFGALGTAMAIIFARNLPATGTQASALLIPASFSTVLTGFLLLTTRYKAITQVIGYLILENGIYIFGMLLLAAMPFLVELGILLDLFVGIFVVSIILNHINEAFSSMDTRRLTALKE
ncbi:MAG: hydrogenase [Planctomycetia bacterium]|jgi:hydrogenase-4 component E|nr:hydrogenase [Planctomycetia bacterium]